MNSHSIVISGTECSLKFEQLNNSNFVWIYGMLIYITEAKKHSNPSLGPINMENVQNLLKPESLSPNATKLLSHLTLKDPKFDSIGFVASILDDVSKFKHSVQFTNDQILLNSVKELEKKVDDKLNKIALQLNEFGNNIELLNKKFDTLLIALDEKNKS